MIISNVQAIGDYMAFMSEQVRSVIKELLPDDVSDYRVLLNIMKELARDINMSEAQQAELAIGYSDWLTHREPMKLKWELWNHKPDIDAYWTMLGLELNFEGLSCIALRYLSLLASEAPVERVISTQRRLVLLGMYNMKDDLLEARTQNITKASATEKDGKRKKS